MLLKLLITKKNGINNKKHGRLYSIYTAIIEKRKLTLHTEKNCRNIILEMEKKNSLSIEENIRCEIEEDLKFGRRFDMVLNKNIELFANYLNSTPFKHYWFKDEESIIEFIGEPLIEEITNQIGELYYVYISDFIFTGNFNYSDQTSCEYKKDITIKATIRVFIKPNLYFDIQNDVEVWDLNQKLINLLHYNANKELFDFDLIPYNYDKYSKIWPKIDKNKSDDNNQVHVASYYYQLEVSECYERIKQLLSIMLLNYKYSNNYTKNKMTLPAGYKTNYFYDKENNFKLYDRNFLLYAELVIESYYKFWERIGFFLFQFYKPKSNKINDKNLSLFKLVKELKKEYLINNNLQNSHFDWFVDFTSPRNSSFNKLINYRHPFIHFKIDRFSKKATGSLIATVLNSWSENILNVSNTKKLESENKKIKEFIVDHFEICKIGYEHLHGLIGSLPDK